MANSKVSSVAVFFFLAVFSASIEAATLNRTTPFYDGEVVFIGASITEYWKRTGDYGLAVWNENYEPLGCKNVGVAGDRTQNTIDHLNSGYVDNLRSRVVVLNIGNNDLAGGLTPDHVVAQTQKIIQILRQKFPGVKVILVQVLPRTPASIHDLARKTNEKLRGLDNGNDVRYLDMENKFCTGLGQIITNLYQSDGLHLKAAGYRVWADNMRSLFNEVLHG